MQVTGKMYHALNKKFIRYILEIMLAASFISGLFFLFFMGFTYHFHPSSHECSRLFYRSFDIVPAIVIGAPFRRKHYFNGAIREGLSLLELDIDALAEAQREKPIYFIKWRKIHVKRKYQKAVLHEIERRISQQDCHKILSKRYE